MFEGFVGGEDDGAPFVAGTDDLEEEIGTALVDGEVTDFVEDEELRVEVAAQFRFEVAFELSGAESVDDINGVGKEDGVTFLAG